MQNNLYKKKIKLLKIEITIRNDYGSNKNQFVNIVNFLNKYNYNIITISKVKYSKNKLMFMDVYFK